MSTYAKAILVTLAMLGTSGCGHRNATKGTVTNPPEENLPTNEYPYIGQPPMRVRCHPGGFVLSRQNLDEMLAYVHEKCGP